MLQNIVDRIKVIATAAVTYITIISAGLIAFADAISEALPERWQEPFGAAAVTIVAVLAEAVAIIRRVTPVDPGLRGITPKPGSTPMEGVDY